MDELAANNGVGCFVTLTYAETDGILHKDHLQKFMKRLRRSVDVRIRFFACGEYGGKNDRPHYHLLLFGWKPDDLVFVWRKNGNDYYKSPFIEKLWKFGFNTVGDITIDTAMYCAKYLQKLDERPHTVKPFTVMSLKPGIGYLSVTPDDILREKRYINGKAYPLPRYYVRRLERDGFNVDMLKLHRQQIAGSLLPDLREPEHYEALRIKQKRIDDTLKKVVIKS